MPSLGKYALIQQLGFGSMGTVYLARDSVLDREVALKTIRTGTAVEAEMRERFYREAKTCARLQHPNIVTVFDLGEQDNFAYIAMELLAGSDFRKFIESRAELDLIIKVEAMIQVCEALGYAHQQGIIHRDVKPSNLFLCENNRAKVLDFGIARLPSSRLTIAGRVLGTPNYMAPEQILGKRSDARADLFSAAVVFFEFLTNHHPFQSDLIPRRIVDSEPDSLFDHDSSIPVPFEPVFTRALAKDPGSRYGTAEEFAADLRAVVDGLRQNASPRFSKFPLPSLRAPVATIPAEVTILNPMDAADPGGASLPRFLDVLATFDTAIQGSDLERAETALANLRVIAGNDGRFAESLNACREKINALKPEPPSSPVPGDSVTSWIRMAVSATEAEPSKLLPERPRDSESAGTLCVCGARNRSDASFCIECGNSIAAPPFANPRQQSPDPAPAPKTASLAVSRPPSPRLWPKTAAATLRAGCAWAEPRARVLWLGLAALAQRSVRGTGRYIIGSAALAICALLVLYLVFHAARIPIEPHIGKAVVQARETRLRKSTNASSPAIASLATGTTVDILALPALGSRMVWQVQPIVGSKALSKGYIDGSALGNWTFFRPDTALAWARLVSASGDETGSDPEREAEAFHTVVARFPETPQANTAALEEADIYLRLGKQKRRDGVQDAVWRSYTEKARSLAAMLVPDSKAAGILLEVDQMIAAPESPLAPQPVRAQVSDGDDARDLARAQQLKFGYDYDGAIEILSRMLKRRPGNNKALELLSEAQQARDLEHGKTQ